MKQLMILSCFLFCLGCDYCNEDCTLPNGETIKAHHIRGFSVGDYFITKGPIPAEKFIITGRVEYIGWTQDYVKSIQVTQNANAQGGLLTGGRATNNLKLHSNSVTIKVRCEKIAPKFILEVIEGGRVTPAVLLDCIKQSNLISFTPYRINQSRPFSNERGHSIKSIVDTYYAEEIRVLD